MPRTYGMVLRMPNSCYYDTNNYGDPVHSIVRKIGTVTKYDLALDGGKVTVQHDDNGDCKGRNCAALDQTDVLWGQFYFPYAWSHVIPLTLDRT